MARQFTALVHHQQLPLFINDLVPDDNRFQTWTRNHRRVGLAVTTDWENIERLGPLSSEHLNDCNVVLFPGKVGGKYVYLHRPTGGMPWLLPCRYNPGATWILFCDKINHWSSNRREMLWDMSDTEDIPDDDLLIKPEYDWKQFKGNTNIIGIYKLMPAARIFLGIEIETAGILVVKPDLAAFVHGSQPVRFASAEIG